MSEKIIDVESVKDEPKQNQALQVRETGGAIDRAMTIDELRSNLAFIKDVMRTVMVEGQDYGKIPGCGDKPGLFQPGAQKLCMTFQLTDAVKKEVIRDLPNYHREYEITISLTSQTGRSWEGVGTCSTMESKYRYRKAERKCPKCGQNTIIKGKAEYGGGWICFGKKGGCGAKFNDNDTAITSQAGGQVENENPADHWNTVRKMAFKRALVHASINATNTSELWSQDLEDLPDSAKRHDKATQEPQGEAAPAQRLSTPPTASGSSRAPNPPLAAPAKPSEPAFATKESLEKMIATLQAGPGQASRQVVTEYFQKIDQLLPNEEVEDLPLRFVPATKGQMRILCEKIGSFANGDPAVRAFEPNTEPPKAKGSAKKPIELPAGPGSQHIAPAIEVPRDPPSEPLTEEEKDLWFMKVIAPVPRKGMKRDEYLKNPDTIGSLWSFRHGTTDEAAEARQRLFGFVSYFEPKGWTKRDGTQMPPSQADIEFRKALDAFMDWFEQEHPEEKL